MRERERARTQGGMPAAVEREKRHFTDSRSRSDTNTPCAPWPGLQRIAAGCSKHLPCLGEKIAVFVSSFQENRYSTENEIPVEQPRR